MPTDTTRITSQQGPWGDCYVVAGINALGTTQPQSLLAMVSRSGQQVVVRTHLGTYRMDATLPYLSDGRPAYASMSDGSTLAAYIEKATAAHFGSYEAVEVGHSAGFLYWAVGDRYPEAKIVDVRTMGVDEIRRVMESGRPATVDIVPMERRDDIPANLGEHNLRNMHVYVPENLDSDGGLDLKNPWGLDDSVGMTLDILQRMNASLHWVDS
ncbi:C2 family cysteine protease [Nocardia sp. NPDC003963]